MAGEHENEQDSHGAEGVLVAGRYRLIERLGAGGMGRVWKAHDESLDCEVAVKEVWLPPMLSDAERADRLARAQREARNAARMRNHPHIVSVHDMVSDRGMPWIIMDLIPSQNLMQAVEQYGPLPQEQVAKIGLGVLDALTASHAAGILHRDVKPANVLLTTDGRVLLTDFGIAVQEADMTMTASGVLVGSPEFVAPERARGEASDGASDLFSLGATLYFAAEGRSPFVRDTAVAVLTAILFEDTAPVTRAPGLAPLISGLLTKDPGTRWGAARARPELERLSGATPGGGTRVDGIPGAGSGSGLGSGLGSGSGSGSGSTPNPFVPATMVAGTNGGGGTPGAGIPRPGYPGTPPAGTPYPGMVSAAPPTMAANAVGPGQGFAQTPYPPQPMPFGPGGPGGTNPQGPGFHTSPMPAPRNNTGRNVGLGIGALVLVGGVVAAIALSGGGGDKNQNTVNPPVSSGSHSAPASQSSSASGTNGPTTSQSSSSDSSPSDSDTSSSDASTDPATWDEASTDQTPFSQDALLPASFTDSKGVVYNATNRWTDDCVNSYESTQLKSMLTKYKCDKQAIGTYVDADGRIMVDIAVLPLPDAQTAQNAFKDMQGKSAFTVEDWGIWCPQSGPGADICTSDKNTGNAQQYGYIQPDHRYLIHAVSLYVNLSSDPSAQDWLKPAATSAAKQAGPQVAAQ